MTKGYGSAGRQRAWDWSVAGNGDDQSRAGGGRQWPGSTLISPTLNGMNRQWLHMVHPAAPHCPSRHIYPWRSINLFNIYSLVSTNSLMIFFCTYDHISSKRSTASAGKEPFTGMNCCACNDTMRLMNIWTIHCQTSWVEFSHFRWIRQNRWFWTVGNEFCPPANANAKITCWDFAANSHIQNQWVATLPKVLK